MWIIQNCCELESECFGRLWVSMWTTVISLVQLWNVWFFVEIENLKIGWEKKLQLRIKKRVFSTRGDGSIYWVLFDWMIFFHWKRNFYLALEFKTNFFAVIDFHSDLKIFDLWINQIWILVLKLIDSALFECLHWIDSAVILYALKNSIPKQMKNDKYLHFSINNVHLYL